MQHDAACMKTIQNPTRVRVNLHEFTIDQRHHISFIYTDISYNISYILNISSLFLLLHSFAKDRHSFGSQFGCA